MSKPSSTELIHHPYQAPTGFAATMPAVHKASTVFFASVAAMRARDWRQDDHYSYGLHNTPTTLTLAQRIATLEGGLYTLLCPSGLSAIAVVALALLKQGDDILIPHNSYGPTVDLCQRLLGQYGVGFRFYDPLDIQSVIITPHTKLLWLEAAGSITLEFPDLHSLVAKAKTAGIYTVIDHTWGAGLAFSPFDLGIDISIHALTKYPSGGGDVLMGSICTREVSLHQQLKSTHGQLGIGVAANDVELVLRGLPSLALRYRAQDQTTRQITAWLTQQAQIIQVLHPTLPTHAGYAYWQAICGQADLAAGLVSIIFSPKYTQQQIDQWCDHLQHFRIGFSWGGPVSLVMPYDLTQIRPQRCTHLQQGHLVRLSIGLEEVNDLIADLQRAFEALD